MDKSSTTTMNTKYKLAFSMKELMKKQSLEKQKAEDVAFLAQSAYDDACRPGNPRDTSFL